MRATKGQNDLVCQAIIWDGGTAKFDFPRHIAKLDIFPFRGVSPKLIEVDIRDYPVITWGYGKTNLVMSCLPDGENTFTVKTMVIIGRKSAPIVTANKIMASELIEPSWWFNPQSVYRAMLAITQ